MKKFMILAAALLLVIVLAACNGNEPAALTQPDADDTDVLYGTGNDEYGYDEYEPDYDFIPECDFMWDAFPTFGSWTGTVVEIDVEYSDPPLTFFRLEGESGNATFVADFNTFILGEAPQVGDIITGHYLMDAPMAMIYPPQYNVSVIVNGDFLGVTVDRFDDELLSYGGNLQLNIGDDTVITLQNGEPIGAEYIAHRKLVVVYSITTRSLPPITTPEKIIVLFERFATGPAMLDGWCNWDDIELEFHDIVVDGVGLAGAFPRFAADDDLFASLVPLKAVAGFLGAEVNWNYDSGEVSLEGLNGTISFDAGSEKFTVAGETVTLNQPSAVYYGDIYVPIRFFSEVFGMGSAYSIGGQIFIDTNESDMH